MCGKMMEDKGDNQGSCSNGISLQEFQGFHEDHLLVLGQQDQQQAMQYEGGGLMGGCELGFGFQSEPASILPWSLPQLHPINPVHFSTTTTVSSTITTSNPLRDHDRYLFASSVNPPPPSPPPLPLYGDFYTRRAASALQFGYEGGMLSSDPLGFAGLYMGGGGGGGGGSEVLVRGGGVLSNSSSPFASIHAELGKMSAQEIMDAKALAASKSHSEAERRRRERINAHLAKLRSLLPSTTKTDKASLLAEVIQHVKELKRQTLEIAEESPLPTESDELTVDAANDEDGKFIVKASLCCEDRSDLIPELIKALKALRLRTLKAEITTLGGRIKNVLVITGEEDSEISNQQHQSITSIQDALRAVMERTNSDDPSSTSGGIKRQRTTNLSSILEHRSI